LKNSFYPDMELTLTVPVVLEGLIQAPTPEAIEGKVLVGGRLPDDVILAITCFADSAPPRKQEFRLSEADYDQKLKAMLSDQVRRLR